MDESRLILYKLYKLINSFVDNLWLIGKVEFYVLPDFLPLSISKYDTAQQLTVVASVETVFETVKFLRLYLHHRLYKSKM